MVVMRDTDVTHTLLQMYKTQWLHVKNGDPHVKDWENITYALNKEFDDFFNPKQVSTCTKTLKKTYKKELGKILSIVLTPTK